MSGLRVVEAAELCDRCDHPSKYHAGPERGSHCMIVDGKVWHGERVPRGMRAKQCLCNGFFPKSRSA